MMRSRNYLIFERLSQTSRIFGSPIYKNGGFQPQQQSDLLQMGFWMKTCQKFNRLKLNYRASFTPDPDHLINYLKLVIYIYQNTYPRNFLKEFLTFLHCYRLPKIYENQSIKIDDTLFLKKKLYFNKLKRGKTA
jgi:hypothetical protein